VCILTSKLCVCWRGGGDRDGLTTLNARVFVWEAALASINASPLVGHGFIVGPKSLGEFVGQSWWHAPHAHNDILNAAVGGGLFVATLTAAIYVRLAKATFGSCIPQEVRIPIVAIIIQVGIYSLLTPVFSSAVTTIGIIMLMIIRYIAILPICLRRDALRIARVV